MFLRMGQTPVIVCPQNAANNVQDREQVDSEREEIEVKDNEEGDKTRTNNARSNM